MFVMHAAGVYSVYSPHRIVGTTFRQSETACFLKNVTHCTSSGFEECHHHEFQFCRGRRRRSMRQVSLLLFVPFPSCFPILNVIIIFTSFELVIRILTHLFARMNWFVTLLVVADILFLLRHNVLLQLSREPNALNFVLVQLSSLKSRVSPKQLGRKTCSFSPISISPNDFRYSSSAFHLERIVR